jgi:gliding motility-associated lipoprotein GldB
MNRILIGLFILFLGFSCGTENETIKAIQAMDLNVEVDRFEQKFYAAKPNTLVNLKQAYPYLFPTQNHDSIWINRINNPEERELYNEAQEVFGDFGKQQTELEDLFKHITYYHKGFTPPKIMTLISDLDYESRVMYADSLLFISLDLFLGKNNDVYFDYFPAYISENFDPGVMNVAVAKTIVEVVFQKGRNRQFIDNMIEEGKKMYLIDLYLPQSTDGEKMGYSQEKQNWVEENQAFIWTYFIENKLLYSTDPNLQSRFIDQAPFSKFYMDFDRESPGSIGVWVGWQIVRSYMQNNNVTLQQLLQSNTEKIFKKSKYKPKK